jgi:hypothetical protein
MKKRTGDTVWATDGPVGSVDQFFFDDEHWAVRYLVVDTGKWLPGRRVLISPYLIHGVDWNARAVLLSIRKAAVRNSPDIDTDRPVSRQKEAEYLRYYGFPYYWGGAALWGPVPYPGGFAVASDAWARARVRDAAAEPLEPGDSHLRSTREVIGYHLHASDGEIGHVEDFLVEEGSWAIRYIVIDTSNWWFGKKVVISPGWIRDVSWRESKVYVDVERQAVKEAPEYDAAAVVTREWEHDYFAHFGREPYWTDENPLERRSLRP